MEQEPAHRRRHTGSSFLNLIRRHHLVLQVAVGAAFLALLAWRINLPEALRGLGDVDARWLAAATVAFILATGVEGGRWWLLLAHRANVSVLPTLFLYAVSRMANMVLPLRGGDLVRIHIAGRRFQISRTEVAATVFAVETPLNWITSVTLLIVALSVLDLPVLNLAYLPRRILVVFAVLLSLGFFTMVAVSRADRSRDYTHRWPLRLLPQGMRRGLADFTGRFLEGTETLRDSRRLGVALGVSMLIWVAQTAVFWCLGEAFGFGLFPAEYAIVTVASVLVRTLPLSPSDIGPYEVVITQALVLLGVDATAAGSYAIGAHLWLLALTGAMGLLALWALDLKLTDLVAEHQEEATPRGSA
jgi:uncharacterized protein (TIRG00374 family)